MGNWKNLPQHGKSKPSPQFKMLKHFTEKTLRRPPQAGREGKRSPKGVYGVTYTSPPLQWDGEEFRLTPPEK
jgi:hypothetical protein